MNDRLEPEYPPNNNPGGKNVLRIKYVKSIKKIFLNKY